MTPGPTRRRFLSQLGPAGLGAGLPSAAPAAALLAGLSPAARVGGYVGKTLLRR